MRVNKTKVQALLVELEQFINSNEGISVPGTCYINAVVRELRRLLDISDECLK